MEGLQSWTPRTRTCSKITKTPADDVKLIFKADFVHSVASCVVDEFDPPGHVTEHDGAAFVLNPVPPTQD